MQALSEPLATRYAQAVVEVLAAEFPALDETQLGGLGRLVQRNVARQATDPIRSFEVIVTYSREWRLIPGRGDDRWRVELACYRGHVTAAEAKRELRINEALRAIQPEE